MVRVNLIDVVPNLGTHIINNTKNKLQENGKVSRENGKQKTGTENVGTPSGNGHAVHANDKATVDKLRPVPSPENGKTPVETRKSVFINGKSTLNNGKALVTENDNVNGNVNGVNDRVNGKDSTPENNFVLTRRHSRRLSSTRGLSSSAEYARRKENGVDAGARRVEEGLVPRVKGQSSVTLGQDCGWVRVFTGAEEVQDRGTLVYLTLTTSVDEICSDLKLGEDVTIWMQYGGGASTRLAPSDAPLGLQDAYLQTVGYADASRRSRLGIDVELRHAVAFHAGPAAPLAELAGLRCGAVLVLKGLVFPQWRRRPVAVLASKLFVFPGAPGSAPEEFELCGGEVSVRAPRANKLVLRVVAGVCAARADAAPRTVFLGFSRRWERDLWSDWLFQATQCSSTSARLDVCDANLAALPAALLSFPATQMLHLSRNRLGAAAHGCADLSLLAGLPRLRALHLQHNRLRVFPASLLQLTRLVTLDLADNQIAELPAGIHELANLEELRLDRNVLRSLPESLGRLRVLKALLVAANLLTELPSFLLAMRALNILELQGNCLEAGKLPASCEDDAILLDRVNLRANLLKGNIILGNYGNLTQLDVSENCIETLDLSALDKLESVQCSKNLLEELVLNGRSLVSLIAGNNKLRKLLISPPPIYLKHLDVSYNELDELPAWTAACRRLRALFASHNRLRALPEQLFGAAAGSLHTLQLGYNQLRALPPLATPTSLQELFLQSNDIAALPYNFFSASTSLRVLNLSNNRLRELPSCTRGLGGEVPQLEKLYVTANRLADAALLALAAFQNLRTLHAAYNCFTHLADNCVEVWQDLEELVLSGNQLQSLPDCIVHLEHLRVLRVHSNRLQSCPAFGQMMSLKVLDLAHNHLDRVNLASLVPTQLQFLDLSCNSKLHVDPRQFQVYRTHRPMSLVDVSGQNRTSLPSVPFSEGGGDFEPPWKIGFSETAGQHERLYISQVRLPAFCNTEGLFALFDGGNNAEIPNVLVKAVPRILLEERTVKETAADYMKYTMLSAHRELKEKGQKYGVCATLVHISRSSPRRYTLRVASVGEATAVLCRGAATLPLATATRPRTQLGRSALFPLVLPDPAVAEVMLEERDDFLIVANKRLWEVVDAAEAAREVRAAGSAILAAKRLQDVAQGYGCEDALSVIVLRLNLAPSPDATAMLRQLAHVSQRHQNGCHPGCSCNKHADGFYNNGLLGLAAPHDSGPFPDADRSSPSGQSDQASSESAAKPGEAPVKGRHTSVQQHNNHLRQWEAGLKPGATKAPLLFGGPQSVLMHENGTRKISGLSSNGSRGTREGKRAAGGGVLRALRARLDGYANGHLADGEDDETGSEPPPSDEQYRCWEYMLEQNTQLLFDKELDTLSRAFARQNVARSAALLERGGPWNTSLRTQDKALSRSSPHLSAVSAPAPFLSRHFGSARSFAPPSRLGSGRQLNGGPNAAYFGSLQRLMPYNLEYNFSVIQERDHLDSLEHDSRMQQYWGVATTEL